MQFATHVDWMSKRVRLLLLLVLPSLSAKPINQSFCCRFII